MQFNGRVTKMEGRRGMDEKNILQEYMKNFIQSKKRIHV
jgi:hypothetical protein